MTIIERAAPVDAYDAEIASQDDDDLLSDLDALRANLRRKKLSSIPDIDRRTRAIFRRWIKRIIIVLKLRGVTIPPEPVKAKRDECDRD